MKPVKKEKPPTIEAPQEPIVSPSTEPTAQAEKHLLLKTKEYLHNTYDIRFNVLTLDHEIKVKKDKVYSTLDDQIIDSIWMDLQLIGLKISDKTLIKIFNKYNERFHPIQTYLNALSWNNKDYIGELAKTVTIQDIQIKHGEETFTLESLWRSYLEKWLVSSVACGMGGGTNQTCLVLAGGQGKGKTTWLNKLCPPDLKEYLVCSHINPQLTDNNTCNFLSEKWFVNVDDQLETIFGKDFNSMKAVITAPFVTNRKAYAKLTKQRQRVCNFMASVNSTQFLTDSENRRYLCFLIDDIEFTHKVDIKGVWAQAMTLYKAGREYWFNQEEIKKLNSVNAIFTQQTLEEEWIQLKFSACEPEHPSASFKMASEILTEINISSGLKLFNLKKISSAMKKLGFHDPISKRINGSDPRKVYPVLERSNVQSLFNKAV